MDTSRGGHLRCRTERGTVESHSVLVGAKRGHKHGRVVLSVVRTKLPLRRVTRVTGRALRAVRRLGGGVK